MCFSDVYAYQISIILLSYLLAKNYQNCFVLHGIKFVKIACLTSYPLVIKMMKIACLTLHLLVIIFLVNPINYSLKLDIFQLNH